MSKKILCRAGIKKAPALGTTQGPNSERNLHSPP